MKSASEYRAQARKALEGKWGEAVLASVCMLVIGLIFMGPGQAIMMCIDKHLIIPEWGFLGGGCYIGYLLVGVPASFGFSIAFLRLLRGSKETVVCDLANAATGNWWRSIGVTLLVGLMAGIIGIAVCVVAFPLAGITIYLTLPEGIDISMIGENPLLIGGIGLCAFVLAYFALLVAVMVYALAVSMTYYIMEDHPEMGLRDAIRASRKMMKGHKWQLFCLEFSFIGWALVCVLTAGIGILWVAPYEYAAIAAFYEDLNPKPAEDVEVVEVEVVEA